MTNLNPDRVVTDELEHDAAQVEYTDAELKQIAGIKASSQVLLEVCGDESQFIESLGFDAWRSNTDAGLLLALFHKDDAMLGRIMRQNFEAYMDDAKQYAAEEIFNSKIENRYCDKIEKWVVTYLINDELHQFVDSDLFVAKRLGETFKNLDQEQAA